MKCKNCKNDFTEKYSKWSNGDFCSKKCARIFSRKQSKQGTKIVHCIDCKKEIEVDKRASDKLCKCDDCKKTKNIKRKEKLNKDQIIEAMKSCNSMMSVARKLKMPFTTFRRYAIKYQIWNPNPSGKGIDHLNLEKLINGEIQTNISTVILKKKLYKNKLKKNICEKCGLKEWNNEPIVCELHHIDGNHKNNKLENLIILCPNCHSQTENYRKGYVNKIRKPIYDNNYNFIGYEYKKATVSQLV